MSIAHCLPIGSEVANVVSAAPIKSAVKSQTTTPPQAEQPTVSEPLHQLALVRKREGVSQRTMAKRLGVDLTTVRNQENPNANLTLSQLYKWQAALDVPITELLADREEPLSAPVLQRAQMVRLMKTVALIRQQTNQTPIKRMAQMLVNQLIEVMPELEEVRPWNAVGERRSINDLGIAASRQLPRSMQFEAIDPSE
jgi:transcriptional regulator with XRE-family HTH domain